MSGLKAIKYLLLIGNNLKCYSLSWVFSDINPNYNGTDYSSHDIEIYKPLSSTGKEHFKLDGNADKYRHWGKRTKNWSLDALS